MVVTLDFICLRFNHETGKPEVMLQKRTKGPAAGQYALIGGWVWEGPEPGSPQFDLTLDDAVERIMRSKAGLMPRYLEQVKVEGSLNRDPDIGWSVTIPYLCLFSRADAGVNREEEGIHWEPLEAILSGAYPLPFDHGTLVANAYSAFQNKIKYSSLLLYLLPEQVSISQVVDAYALFGITVKKQTVISRWVKTGLLAETGEKKSVNTKGPAATLYRLVEPELTYFDSEIGKSYSPAA